MDATLRAILEEVGRRPLRASVITATALMDTMLEKVISAFIIEDTDKKALFDYSGCMSTFSAKIEMSYVLGLISKELRDDLNRYRRIRNKCAHNIVLDADAKNEIKSEIGNFSLLKKVFQLGNNEDPIVYTGLEFALIFICLFKRCRNLNHLSAFPCEVHEGYLGFTDEDNDLLEKFKEFIEES